MSREGFDNAGALHHVEINVSNLARSCEFWGWLLGELGYEAFQRWDEGASWKRGATYIVFVQTTNRFKDHRYHRRATGLNHLAFHARSKEHVDTITAELARRGCPVLYRDQHPHAGGEDHYAVFFEDPDRIKVELVAPSDNSEASR